MALTVNVAKGWPGSRVSTRRTGSTASKPALAGPAVNAGGVAAPSGGDAAGTSKL